MIAEGKTKKARDVFFKAGVGVAVFGITFFAAFLSSSHFMPVSKSSAETTGDYYATITNTGAIDIDLVATPDGIGKVGKDTLSIDTNATSGYKLYLSTVSTAPNNSLYLSSDTSTGITATTGSIATPSKLATNTWGYAPSRATSTDTITTYTDAAADAVTGSPVFIGVPEYGNENIVYTNTTPTTSGSNTVDVYFGVNASTALPSGEYSNTVVYTAIVDAVNPSSEEISISPTSQNGLAAGTPITISTGLYPGFSADNLGTITAAIGGNNCTNVAGSLGENGNLVITCNAPAASTGGTVDVVVSVEKYGKTYTLTNGYEYNPTPAFYTITTMQEMTADVCNSVHTPNNGTGSNITLVDNANDYLNTYNVTTDGTRYVPQRTLYDIRDNNSYTVRKLADGNCWMTQDLKLGGNTAMTLTPENTNITSSYILPVQNTGTWCTSQNAACYDQSLWVKSGVPNGYLYNWYTATASTGTYSLSSGNATASICPKGWKLPTGGAGGNFANLDIAYGGNGTDRTDANQRNKFMAAPPSFNYTGYRHGSIEYPSTVATYWSITTNSITYAYYFVLKSDGTFFPQVGGGKYRGAAIRCVAAQ